MVEWPKTFFIFFTLFLLSSCYRAREFVQVDPLKISREALWADLKPSPGLRGNIHWKGDSGHFESFYDYRDGILACYNRAKGGLRIILRETNHAVEDARLHSTEWIGIHGERIYLLCFVSNQMELLACDLHASRLQRLREASLPQNFYSNSKAPRVWGVSMGEEKIHLVFDHFFILEITGPHFDRVAFFLISEDYLRSREKEAIVLDRIVFGAGSGRCFVVFNHFDRQGITQIEIVDYDYQNNLPGEAMKIPCRDKSLLGLTKNHAILTYYEEKKKKIWFDYVHLKKKQTVSRFFPSSSETPYAMEAREDGELVGFYVRPSHLEFLQWH